MGEKLTGATSPRCAKGVAAGLLITLLIAGFGQAVGAAGLAKIQVVDDLQALGRAAETRQIPILLLMSQEWCPYCDQIKNEILNPMLRSGEYEDRVVLAEFMIDSHELVKGFDGAELPGNELARQYDVGVTPTLLFLDSHGRELTARLRGINTPEFFSFYVDRGIERAHKSASDRESR